VSAPGHQTIPDVECAGPVERADLQAERLAALLATIHGSNPFYTRKLDRAGVHLESLRFPGDLRALPLTTKAELIADQSANPPWGTALTEPLGRYTRYCQTSSTTGLPLRWLDTNDSWQWMLDCWKAVYRAAGISSSDRIFFPFSFGPFLGFWTAFEAGCQIGAHCIPGGGMASHVRVGIVETLSPTVICCTPTYALRLAEVAADGGKADLLVNGSVRVVVVAGEPGGSIPATRARIEQRWGARVIDHHGLTEVGPLSFECWEQPGGLHLNEAEYVCEVIDPETLEPVDDGAVGELVVTNLGRAASPVIRYRTGDTIIRRSGLCACGRTLVRAEGGILARRDDMVNVRGVNVFPSAIEAVVRTFPEIGEFRSSVTSTGTLRSLSVEIETGAASDRAERIRSELARHLREALGLTIAVRLVAPGSLPQFEMKARRFIVQD
jgi:phenylacetate-CoA ligase